jgi:hypothetical protein
VRDKWKQYCNRLYKTRRSGQLFRPGFNEIALLLLLQGSFRGPVSFGSQSFYINNNTFTDAYGGLMLLKFDL